MVMKILIIIFVSILRKVKYLEGTTAGEETK